MSETGLENLPTLQINIPSSLYIITKITFRKKEIFRAELLLSSGAGSGGKLSPAKSNLCPLVAAGGMASRGWAPGPALAALQSVVLKVGSWDPGSPGNLLETKIFRPKPQFFCIETLEVGPSNLF